MAKCGVFGLLTVVFMVHRHLAGETNFVGCIFCTAMSQLSEQNRG